MTDVHEPDDDGRLSRIVSLTDFEPLARAVMGPADFDYVAGGAWDDNLDAAASGGNGSSAGGPGSATSGTAAAARPRPVIPGERQFRDGDRIRHARCGDGIVVTSKLTRSDEEVTVAFKDASVGRKTMLVSLANLDLIG